MSTVKDLERAVRQLSRKDLVEFRRWFVEFDQAAWDQQLEQDIAAGRLDHLADEALAEFRQGRTRPL
jgi:hypothetical protein